MPIYLDYQATTPLDPRVRDAMDSYWTETFGNPHSEGHTFGWEAREAVEFARSQVANLIGSDDNEIIFVSGATESCNLALRGIAVASNKRRQIITLATEHPAVLDTVQWLGCHGFDVEILPVLNDGLLDLSVLENVLSDKTLVDGGVVGSDLINHGLNTVLIGKSTNIILGGKEPALYLDDIKKNDQLTDEQLKNRIESHFVPYDELIEDNGTVKDRYEEYLKARANVIWKEIKARTE